MNFLLDNNLSPQLCRLIKIPGISIRHVSEFSLAESSDQTIWKYAQKNDLIIVTKDVDFNEISFLNGFPPFVVWLKIGNCTTSDVQRIIEQNISLLQDITANKYAGVIEIEL